MDFIHHPEDRSRRVRNGRSRSGHTASPRLNRKSIFMLATVLSVVMVFVFCLDFVLQQQRFPTRNIDVVGDLANTTSNEVAEAVAKVSAGNILRVDIARAAQAAQSLSWVEDATIRRKWPDTLEVQVNVRKVRARWNEDEYLDQFGNPFSLPSQIDRSLPLLRGPTVSAPEVLTAYETWSESVRKVGLKVQTIWLSKRGSWEIFVIPQKSAENFSEIAVEAEPIKVIVGSSDIKERSKRFLKLYAEIFHPVHEKVSVIDMRYPDGVSVTWRGSPPKMQGIQTIANT